MSITTLLTGAQKKAADMGYMGVPEMVAQRLIAHNFTALQVKLDQMTLL